MGRYWSVLGDTGSVQRGTGDTGLVWSDTGWYLMVLGQYGAYWFVLGGTGSVDLVLLDFKWNWVSTRLLFMYILKKSGDLVGCYHSGTTTNKER